MDMPSAFPGRLEICSGGVAGMATSVQFVVTFYDGGYVYRPYSTSLVSVPSATVWRSPACCASVEMGDSRRFMPLLSPTSDGEGG